MSEKEKISLVPKKGVPEKGEINLVPKRQEIKLLPEKKNNKLVPEREKMYTKRKGNHLGIKKVEN